MNAVLVQTTHSVTHWNMKGNPRNICKKNPLQPPMRNNMRDISCTAALQCVTWKTQKELYVILELVCPMNIK